MINKRHVFPFTICEQRTDLPLCKLQVTFSKGSATDQSSIEGNAVFTGELMVRSIDGASYIQIKEALAQLGAKLSVYTGLESTTFELVCLKQNLPQAKKWLKHALLKPSYSEEEAQRIKREMLEELIAMQDDDASLASHAFTKELFKNHSYGVNTRGTMNSIGQLSTAIAQNWYQNHLSAQNAIFGAAGDISQSELDEFANEVIPFLPSNQSFTQEHRQITPQNLTNPQLLIVDKPERTQTQVFIGHIAPGFGSPLFLPLHIGLTAFGGTFTSRLMREIRSKRGLSYGVSAALSPHQDCSALVMHVYPFAEQAAQTLELMLSLYDDFRTQGLQKEEIDFAKNFLSSSHPFDMQTPEQKLRYKTKLVLLGAPIELAEDMPSQIEKITPHQINEAILTILKPCNVLISMLCSKELVSNQIEKSPVLSQIRSQIISSQEIY